MIKFQALIISLLLLSSCINNNIDRVVPITNPSPLPPTIAEIDSLSREDLGTQIPSSRQSELTPTIIQSTADQERTVSSRSHRQSIEPVKTPTIFSATLSPISLKTPTSTATTEENLSEFTAVPMVTPTATYWPTVTRQILSADLAANLPPCEKRQVKEDLLVIVSNQFGLPSSYVPSNLVAMTDHFPAELTRDETIYVSSKIIEPLRLLLDDMHVNGLQPSILSGYRSYQEQQLAWHWWESKYPERVAIISARPGYSEHQIGTTVDFGSPALNHLFNLDFESTPEGIWLADNAHRFGFTMSFPPGSYDVTGFQYEPWHFRYIGEDSAKTLKLSSMTLTEWQSINLPPPCIP